MKKIITLFLLFTFYNSFSQNTSFTKLEINVNNAFKDYSIKSKNEYSEDIKHAFKDSLNRVLVKELKFDNTKKFAENPTLIYLVVEEYFNQFKRLNEIENQIKAYKPLKLIMSNIMSKYKENIDNDNITIKSTEEIVREKDIPSFTSIFSGYATLAFDIDPSAIIDVFLNGIKVNLSNPSQRNNLKIKVHAGERYDVKVKSRNKSISLGIIKLKSEEVKLFELNLK